MKKYIIMGAFELDKNVIDLAAYEKPKKRKLKELVDWCHRFGISISCGTTDDNIYLCEYRVVGKTKDFCNGLLRELKDQLKEIFPYVKTYWPASGGCW